MYAVRIQIILRGLKKTQQTPMVDAQKHLMQQQMRSV